MAEELKQGALLCHEAFRIEKKLGQGGFGTTYLARDLGLDRLVAIKEFFPKDYCGRDDTTSRVKISTDSAGVIFTRYKEKFLKEARIIARLYHPRIIKIYTAFEDNGTAYYVMEYLDGISLAEMVKAQGPLSVPIALEYIKGVGEALSYVHSHNINHLDVKPANIMVRREDNCPILIDFGLSKQYDATGAQTSTTPPGISHGYAPTEQYTAGGVSKFSPQTDIYSLAATLYYLLSGETPPQATQLIQEELRFPASIPAELRPAIATGMMPAISQRYPTVAAFIAALSSPLPSPLPSPLYSPLPSPDDATVIVEPESKPESKPESLQPVQIQPTQSQSVSANVTPSIKPLNKPKKKNSKLFLWGGGLAAVLAIVLLIFFWQKESVMTTAEEGLHYDEDTSELVVGINRYKMIHIEGGSFYMGGTSEQEETTDVEKPVHHVTLSSYSIGQTEVPQWLWVAVMQSNSSANKGDYFPVDSVSWDDCQEFIKKLNTITGKSFKLPTEAQWEYAARGGNKSKGYQYSGSNAIDEVAWHTSNKCTHKVGTKSANELGLYDMSGNVWEWCSDWYELYSSNSVTDPTGPSEGIFRVYRGGCWFLSPWFCRVSYRSNEFPSNRLNFIGFRLAL